MTAYFELSPIFHILFGVFALLLMAASVFIFVNVCVFRLRLRNIVLSFLLLLEVMFVFQGITEVSLKTIQGLQTLFFAGIIGNLPYYTVILWLLLSLAGEVIFAVYINGIRKNILTPMAIKESLDALPDGVCFYLSGGQTLLVNTKMNQISGELFNTQIMNAESFLNNLKLNNSSGRAHIVSAKPTLVIQTEDNKVWDFRHSTLSVENSEVQELVAYDVTEQYCLNKELEIRNKRLSGVNERLRVYSRQVESVITEKEILSAKVRVHDDIGRSLLAFRSYLAKPQSERDRESLLLLWRYTISVMKKESVTEVQSDDWELLLKAAKAVDVEIECNGNLPDKGKIRDVLIAALHECLTNTVKHANGNRLYLAVRSDDQGLTAEITNNGIQPKEKITETGGLKNLRYTVESAGGIMNLEIVPGFLLRIEFPEEE